MGLGPFFWRRGGQQLSKNFFLLLHFIYFFLSTIIIFFSGMGVSIFRVFEFPSDQVSELPSFQVSKCPSIQGREGGGTNERPGTDHVTSGPMGGLKKTVLNGTNRQTDTHTHRDRRTWRLYDQLGPVGPSW